MYYNADKILNNPRPFNFLLSNRGIGKSFYWKRYCLRRWINKREQFIYVRRYKDDLKKVADRLFEDVLCKFEGHEIYVDGNVVIVDNEIAGWLIAVSEFTKYKSDSFQYVTTIMFDEFLPEDGRYIGGKNKPMLEPELCLNFYQTVARGFNKPIRDNVIFIFIANTVSMNNPYFRYFNIDRLLSYDTQFLSRDGFNVEIVLNESIKQEIEESRFGSLIKNTPYGAYALGNDFYLDNSEFIDNKQIGKRYIATFVDIGFKFGLWRSESGLYYLTDKVDTNCKFIIALRAAAHMEDAYLVTSYTSGIFKDLRRAYSLGHMRFANLRCKAFFEDNVVR